MIDIAYAMAQPPAGQQQAGSGFFSMLPLILIFFVFYFLLIRPQKKQAQNQKAMINQLKKGDKIVTSGGIYGRITSLKGKQVELEIAPNTKITLNKQNVSQVITDELSSAGKTKE